MENPKKLYARKRMEETFLLLLHKNTIDRISVTKLCDKAGVNRSTFYAHYIDIYDLMDKITDDFVRHLFHDIIGELGIPTGKSSADTYSMVLRSLEVTLQNRELCGLLVRSRANISERLISETLNWCKGRYEQFSDKNNPDYQLGYTMMLGGAIVLWYDWVRSDFAAPTEQLAKAIADFIGLNISMIWGSGRETGL